MFYLRSLLLIFFAVIALYTFVVVLRDGLGLIPVFLDGLFSVTWQGQFNLDFGMYLALASLWIMWRGGFTPAAVVLGLAAPWLGMTFFAAYLLYLSYRTDGDLRRLLLGVHAT